MTLSRQQWSIKSFGEWTGRKLARVLVPLVLVLGAGQDDAHGQAWRINNVTGWWSHGGPQATQNAAQNAACAGGPSYLDFVFEQVAGAGRSLRTAGHTVCDLGYGVLQIADWANASCAASLWNLRPVSRTNLPPQWPWGGQSPLTKGYDELTNNGNCSLAQTLDASAVVSWSGFRTQVSFGLVELAQGIESDLEGRTKGAAGEAFVNVFLSLIPLRGLKCPNISPVNPVTFPRTQTKAFGGVPSGTRPSRLPLTTIEGPSVKPFDSNLPVTREALQNWLREVHKECGGRLNFEQAMALLNECENLRISRPGQSGQVVPFLDARCINGRYCMELQPSVAPLGLVRAAINECRTLPTGTRTPRICPGPTPGQPPLGGHSFLIDNPTAIWLINNRPWLMQPSRLGP